MKQSCSIADFFRLARQRQAVGGLSALRQLLEIAVLMPIYGVGPGFYQMAGFWKRDIAWCDKISHLNPTAYRRVVDSLNPREYRKISQNKLSEKAMLRFFNLPSPAYIGYYNSRVGQDASGQPLQCAADLERLLRHLGHGSRVCFKPLEGWAGEGFEIGDVHVQGSGAHICRVKTGSIEPIESFIKEVIDTSHAGASLMESFLKQHPVLAELNPSSVNTVRLWAAQDRNCAQVTILLAYLRIGRAGSLVDNQSNGGIVAPIDLDTGELSSAIDGLHIHEVFDYHPDHGSRIKGQKVPDFHLCREVAAKALLAFPAVRFAGMDIAITDSGPQVIELNLSPDREGAAFVSIPSGPLLRPFADDR